MTKAHMNRKSYEVSILLRCGNASMGDWPPTFGDNTGISSRAKMPNKKILRTQKTFCRSFSTHTCQTQNPH